MKTPLICLITAAVACTAGLGAGWLLWGGKEAASKNTVAPPAAKTTPHEDPRQPDRKNPPAGGAHTADVVASALEKMKSQTPEEFGAAMVDAWLAYGDPDSQLRRALYLSACDGKRAMAFYTEYKRRKGLGPQGDPGLREFFTVMGRKDGRAFLSELLAASPEGIAELDSITHGWARADAGAVVDWLNGLPENAPYYQSALQGIMWGLAEASPSNALKVYETLDPAARTQDVVKNISNATVTAHGIKGLVDLLPALKTEPERQQFLVGALDALGKQPPGDFVKMLAGSIGTDSMIAGQYGYMATRWATSDPEAAIAWVGDSAQNPGGETAITAVAGSLARKPEHAEALRAWVAAHPNAPGRPAIESALAAAAAESPQ